MTQYRDDFDVFSPPTVVQICTFEKVLRTPRKPPTFCKCVQIFVQMLGCVNSGVEVEASPIIAQISDRFGGPLNTTKPLRSEPCNKV